MESPKYTVYIIQNEQGKSVKFSIPQWILKTLAAGIFVIVSAFAAGFIDYFGLLWQVAENKKLKLENAQLLKQFEVVESKVSALENSLERVRTFTTKLQLITNIDSKDDPAKLTMGPGRSDSKDPVEEFEPMDQRQTSQQMQEQDGVYEKALQPNEGNDELAIEESKQDYASLVVRIEKAVKDTQLREQNVLDLWESLSERQSLLNSTPNIRPARGLITSRFGYRTAPFSGRLALHAGLDIAASIGTPVYAPADGVISFASYDASYGKLVSIDHGYGTLTRFAHLSQIYVQVGQRVSKWDVIATVGNTGRSTGPHLHYEVRKNGTPVNPINYILDE